MTGPAHEAEPGAIQTAEAGAAETGAAEAGAAEPEAAEVEAAEPEAAEPEVAEAAPATRLFGIRHHGPGSARSLVRAFEAFAPDCVLVEGPPEAEAVLPFVLDAALVPPVALLSYCPEDTGLAVFHPFAEYSPEWQALRFALSRGVTARFIDLPQVHHLALEQARQAALVAEAEAEAQADAEADAQAEAAASSPAGDAPAEVDAEPPAEVPGASAAVPASPEPEADTDDEDLGDEDTAEHIALDPLDWLARAAGHGDGERWWNQLVEERGEGDPFDLFAAIAEAMGAVRAEVAPRRGAEHALREARREAHMRRCVRQAQKDGFRRIAVVVGAWHVPALALLEPGEDKAARAAHKALLKADTEALKGLPKVKVITTWVPWTDAHLAARSGYRAGVVAPAWYRFLWQQSGLDGAREDRGLTPRAPGHTRAVTWLARVAGLLRESGLDTSSAHVIEAVRLAEALAALRGRAEPDLDAFNEAVRTVMCFGDAAPLRLIERRLIVGESLGAVPAGVPVVPLQQDLERQQRSLRLKPAAVAKEIDLDLRKDTDLARSHLLHRLAFLGVGWGRPQAASAALGTFHELWTLEWKPEFALRLVEASRWGATLLEAASARAVDEARNTEALGALAALVDRVLVADLPAAVAPVTAALEAVAARAGDAAQLLDALPALANVMRYGNVRRTDAGRVGHVFDGLVARACIGLSAACAALDDTAAEAMQARIVAAHRAVALVDQPHHRGPWLAALGRLAGGVAAAEEAEDPAASAPDLSPEAAPGDEADAEDTLVQERAGAEDTSADDTSADDTSAQDPDAAAAVHLSPPALALGTHGLVAGLAARLRFDEQADRLEHTAQRMSLALSVGADPGPAAAWMAGFLRDSGMVLLHDDGLWQTVDAWLAGLRDDDFVRVLPLIRRTFGQFSEPERRQMGERARQRGAATAQPTATVQWDPERAAQPLPLLALLLGLPWPDSGAGSQHTARPEAP